MYCHIRILGTVSTNSCGSFAWDWLPTRLSSETQPVELNYGTGKAFETASPAEHQTCRERPLVSTGRGGNTPRYSAPSTHEPCGILDERIDRSLLTK